MKQKTNYRIILYFLALAVFLISGWQLLRHHLHAREEQTSVDHLIREVVTISAENGNPDSEDSDGVDPEDLEEIDDRSDDFTDESSNSTGVDSSSNHSTIVGSNDIDWTADLPEPERPILTVNFDRLQQENPDIIGWLYCPDTPINYPVVQSEDNAYYLYRLTTGKYNPAGSLFLDYRNSDDFGDRNSVIYGHNMTNDSMFGSLLHYRDPDYYAAHPLLFLATPDGLRQIELFAGYLTEPTAEPYRFPMTEEEQQLLIDTALSQSTFTADVAISTDDQFITLSTCDDEDDSYRYVVIGVLRAIETEKAKKTGS